MKSLPVLALIGSVAMSASAFAGPGIVINEYLYDPAGDITGDANKDTVVDTADDEFVELVNSGRSAVDLSGWSLHDGSAERHIFPGGTVLGPGCAIIIFGGGHPPINLFGGAIVQTASTGTLGLNNNGDTITIKDSGAVVVATLVYPDNGNVNQSYTRDPDISGVNFVLHDTAAGAAGALFSPGTKVDGTAFGTCVAPGPDADGDGHPDSLDNCPEIANVTQADCDSDGVGDVCQIAANPSLDCNLNGILDSCEPDCNQTGFPDDCDIILGISQDCNKNLIPDECEPDCNGNLIPDECDIANGFSQDANNDGVPDECQNSIPVVINEILADPAAGTSGDANHDGASSSTNDEFIEIVNASGSPVDVGGWTIRDAAGGITGTVRHTFPSPTVLPANCGVIVFGGGTPIGQWNGMTAQIASTGTLSLNNDGDTLSLRDGNGLLVTTVTYGSNAGDDQSLTRNPDITGAFVKHTAAQPGVLFSPGSKVNLTAFGGCPPILTDTDGDGIPDINDNCDFTPNPLQQDCDGDGIGDACDTDPDGNGNGIPDNCEIGVPGNVKISEIRIDQPGSDNDEYFEIRGPAGLSLSGLTYVVIGDGTAGASGIIENITSLTGKNIPADGRFIVCESTTTLIPVAQRDYVLAGGNPGGLNFENSDNVTHLLVTNFTGANAQDLDTNDDGHIDIAPWGAVVDAVGLIGIGVPGTSGVEYAYGADLGGVDVGPDVTFVPGQVYRCESAGTWIVGRFDPLDPLGGTDTPGVANLACTANPCPADRTGNGTVDIDDLLAVINTWGTANPIGDANNSGLVDIDDLLIVIGGWGACP